MIDTAVTQDRRASVAERRVGKEESGDEDSVWAAWHRATSSKHRTNHSKRRLWAHSGGAVDAQRECWLERKGAGKQERNTH